MFRVLVGALATVTVAALAAQPACASRIYAGQPQSGVPDQMVLVLPNSGTAITRVTFHIDVPCGTDFEAVDFGTTRNVDSAPDLLQGGAHYLVRGKVVAGKLSGTIIGADRVNDTTWELMNVVLAGTVTKTKASGSMAVKLVRTDAATGTTLAQCSRVIRWSALRNPGIVYAGATSQDEPIVVELTKDRRHVSHAHVSWLAPCESGGAWIDPHDEFDLKPFPLSRTGAFSRSYDFGFGQGTTAVTEVETFAGRIGLAKGAGTFRADIALTGVNASNTCSTGKISWTVITG